MSEFFIEGIKGNKVHIELDAVTLFTELKFDSFVLRKLLQRDLIEFINKLIKNGADLHFVMQNKFQISIMMGTAMLAIYHADGRFTGLGWMDDDYVKHTRMLEKGENPIEIYEMMLKAWDKYYEFLKSKNLL